MAKERRPRCEKFVVSPRQIAADSIGMSPLGVAAFFLLWAESFNETEPGVLPADDRYLAGRARATTEEWNAVRSEVAAAFDTTTRPGFWVRPDVVAAHESQTAFIHKQSVAGRASAAARVNRGSNQTPTAVATVVEPVFERRSNGASTVLGSGFSGTEIQKQEPPPLTHSPPAAPQSRRSRDRSESPAFAEFYEQIWPKGRRINRDDAWKAWRSVLGRPGVTEDLIGRGARAWAAWWDSEGTELVYIPYPATWLRAGAFRDPPAGRNGRASPRKPGDAAYIRENPGDFDVRVGQEEPT